MPKGTSAKTKEPRSNSLGVLGFVDLNLAVLREAIKTVPEMRYALAALALIAVAGLSVVMAPGVRLSIVVPALIFVMVILVVFSRILYVRRGDMRLPALVLTWSMTMLFVLTSFTAVSAVALGKPEEFRKFLLKTEDIPPEIVRGNDRGASNGNIQEPMLPFASVSVSGMRYVEKPQSEAVEFQVTITGKNRPGYVDRNPSQGSVWDTSFKPVVIDQVGGEKGSCVDAEVRSETVIRVSGRLGAITNVLGRDKPGWVTCKVQARATRSVREDVPFSLAVSQIERGRRIEISLPSNVVKYAVEIIPTSGSKEILTEESSSGNLAAFSRNGDVLFITARN